MYFENLNKKVKSIDAIGSVLITGIEKDDEDEDDDESGDDVGDNLTQEQVNSLRHVIITKNGEKEIKAYMKKIGEGGDDDVCFFSTFSGDATIKSIPTMVKSILKKKQLPNQFDALFAMTYALNVYDVWMYDNESYEPGKQKFDTLFRQGVLFSY